jgi:hypothetical protein
MKREKNNEIKKALNRGTQNRKYKRNKDIGRKTKERINEKGPKENKKKNYEQEKDERKRKAQKRKR